MPDRAPDPTPLVPPSDSKDWTWVLEHPCPDCGFDSRTVDGRDVAGMIRTGVDEWERILSADPAAVRRRPSPQVWSPLEYACHVRDVNVLYRERLDLMLTEDGPRYPNWDQDETALERRYHESDPSTVAAELRTSAEALADRFDEVTGADWERTGYRGDGASFTISTFAKYYIHDPLHHLDDVHRGGREMA